MFVRIRIESLFSQQQARSGSQKYLDSDRDSMNRDPKHCFNVDLTFGQIRLVWTVPLKIILGMFHSYLSVSYGPVSGSPVKLSRAMDQQETRIQPKKLSQIFQRRAKILHFSPINWTSQIFSRVKHAENSNNNQYCESRMFSQDSGSEFFKKLRSPVPGPQQRIEEFLALENMIHIVYPGPGFFHPESRILIQGSKKHWISYTQHW
jgi:hypothetical protein